MPSWSFLTYTVDAHSLALRQCAFLTQKRVRLMVVLRCDGSAGLLAFRQALMWGDGLAKTTMLCVHYELASWTRWLDARKQCWCEVTPDDLRAWLVDLVSRQAARTVDKRVWVLRRLYRWAHAEGILDKDPWAAITRPVRRVPWQPRYSPSEMAMKRLLEQPDTTTMIGIRDRSILELLYASGLRAMELVSLQDFQISCGAHERSIRIMGKGGQERLVIYGEQTSVWLRYYAKVVRRDFQRGRRQTGQFFLNDSASGVFTYPILRKMIKRYAMAADLPLLTAHSLRHAFATHLYQNGANLRVIQALLGHRQLATTTVYASTSPAQLAKLIEHHHPRGTYYELPPERFRKIDQPISLQIHAHEAANKTDLGALFYAPIERWPRPIIGHS